MQKKYNIVYADPPWQYAGKMQKNSGAEDHYRVMRTEDICALRVGDIADENCVLFIWGTWPKLSDTKRVMKAWGFTYKTAGFVWVKTNKRKVVGQYSYLPEDSFDEFFGQGHWTRANTEFCLIGVRGKIKTRARNVRQIIYAPIQEHSRKPDETRDRIVRLCGDLPRIELFARQRKEGWDAYGNEVESSISLDEKDAQGISIASRPTS